MIAEPMLTARPRRRWPQFSLRTLILLMAAFGLGFGWLAPQVQQARAQQKAETAIEKLGGYVGYWPTSSGMMRTAVDWLGELFGEDWSPDVTGVYLAGAQVDDAGLAHLRGLTQLEVLYLACCGDSMGGNAHR